MTNNKVLYHLLDLLKLVVLISIQTLHAWEFVFFENDFTLHDKSVIFETMSYFARTFSNGGQILVAIIYFLFGFSAKSSRALLKIAGFALIGQLALSLAFMDQSGFFASLEWDIYVFISLSNLLLALLPLKWRMSPYLLFFALLWLLIPTTFWQTLLPAGIFFDILSGRQSAYNSGAWAPLPWFFHTLLFFVLGTLSKIHLQNIEKWHKLETLFWPIILLSGMPLWGAYFHTPIGPDYYSFTFNQHPLVYWCNFLPYVFWIRLSLLKSLQERLSSFKFFKWISNLNWLRKVGLTYLIAVIYVGLGTQFDQEMRSIPYAFDAFYISIMPVAEFLSRKLSGLRDVISSR